MFGIHRPGEGGDIKFSISDEVPRKYVLRGLCVIMGCVPLILSHHPSLAVTDVVQEETFPF